MALAGVSDELWEDEAGDNLDAALAAVAAVRGRRGRRSWGAEVGAVQFFTQVVDVPVINSDKFPQFEVRIEGASDSVVLRVVDIPVV